MRFKGGSLQGVADGEDLLFADVHGIVAVETGGAIRSAAATLHHEVEGDIVQTVRAYLLAYLLFGLVCADELILRLHIHAEVAGEFDGRGSHQHMHLFRAACAEQADDLAGGGAAHYAVVDEDEPFPLDVAAESVEFYLDGARAWTGWAG